MTTKTIDPAIFKAYDVRAVYPTQIDGEVARRVGRAFVDYLGGWATAASISKCRSARAAAWRSRWARSSSARCIATMMMAR